ncbi:hypothetical protein GQR60_12455 [Labilibaculum sp. A4]|uniref:PKD domain-containing protein n=2 Tax=Labilibaculum TaxID=2060722 RepID=A0A425YAH9_9BACT|nr:MULTISPECIES: hypothetical protein [Labilibaculum]MDQ1771365.1 hypothetical protein [Labilibaculum euxinus]MUP39654.1 hypothetical protein [Labilibaculum euxinus]MVB08859.1 hypothetical protein [Labilibaculum euxinus]MWN77153.1 hypothetical protein [Labilibaculum euxinus]PKQ61652.1 hypothetical protein BZG01_18765 [Labilibaculum manganireducens]
MKLTKIFGLLFISLIAFAGTVSAQDQTVTINTSHTYNVDPVAGVTYTWATTGGTSTDLVAQTGNSMTLIWDVAGTYDVTVFGTDANGCLTETRTSQVLVVGAASVMFANLPANDAVVSCSPLLGGTLTVSDFDVVFTGGVAPFELTYEITAIDNSKETKVVTMGTAGDATPLTGQLSISDFENLTAGDQTVSIQLISAKTADNGTVAVDTDLADNTRSVTVHGKPVISGTITLN